MPLHPTRRLNLLLVADRGHVPDAGALDTLVAEGWLGEGGRPGVRADQLVAEGYQRWRLDEAPHGRLYGNRQGGFSVRCPACQGHLARELSRAVTTWQAGGAFTVVCPRCGATNAMDALDYQPDAAPGFAALELRDVGGPELLGTPAALESLLGAYRVIPSRG